MHSDIPPAESLFQCTRCGDCCHGYGGTYVSEEEIHRIAEFLSKDPEWFALKCCRRSGSRYVLGQAENGYCICWDGMCVIHPVKPRMCRAWPFIESVLTEVENWHIMAAQCPGMRTDIPDDVILRGVAAELGKSGED